MLPCILWTSASFKEKTQIADQKVPLSPLPLLFQICYIIAVVHFVLARNAVTATIAVKVLLAHLCSFHAFAQSSSTLVLCCFYSCTLTSGLDHVILQCPLVSRLKPSLHCALSHCIYLRAVDVCFHGHSLLLLHHICFVLICCCSTEPLLTVCFRCHINRYKRSECSELPAAHVCLTRWDVLGYSWSASLKFRLSECFLATLTSMSSIHSILVWFVEW